MLTVIDVSRQIIYEGRAIIFYLKIEYDFFDVSLSNYTVVEFSVTLEEEIYSTYEGGKFLMHDMTMDVLDAINDFIEAEDFAQDILQYEHDNREPNFEMP